MKICILRFSWPALLLSTPLFFGGVGSAPTGTEPGADQDSTAARASASVFLTGTDLGVVSETSPTLIQASPNAVKDAAAAALVGILQARLGLTGQELIQPIASQPIRVEKNQRAHIRLKQYVDGLPLEGASLAIHFDAVTGQVVAANGEVHSSDSIVYADEAASLGCDAAMEVALDEYLNVGLVPSPEGAWMGDCELAAVQGRDGKAYLAYKRLYEARPVVTPMAGSSPNASSSSLADSDPYRVDLLFAERVTGRLVATHPKIIGGRTMTTSDCNNIEVDVPSECTVVTNSPNKINTADPPLDDAHNHAVDTYDFYRTHFGLSGMDGSDLKIQTLAHYGFAYDNAFFTELFGGLLVYGDGDGFQYDYFSQFDVVVHEFSHGVTHFSSNLIYSYESGALNEAFSDVMAATAERLVKNKAAFAVWHMGEDLDLIDGAGFRNMANPPDFFHPDYFASRDSSSWDNGGVHSNSGIMNKAFYLMVQGGTHPVSGIVVPPLSTNFDTSIKQAATIFFNANTMCLTESSDYAIMRACTLLFASATQKAAVEKAWDAVGVKALRPLVSGVRSTGITLPFDNDVQIFQLDRKVNAGEKVTCSLFADNGDPDLAVRFGRPPSVYPLTRAGDNNCYSDSVTGNETCTTGAATAANTTVFVSVEAFEAAANIQLLCTVQGACKARNTRCTAKSQCCNPATTACDGPTASTRVCKACKARAARCTRATECCGTQACDGTASTNRVCKACKARQAVCTRTTQCCAGLKCTGGRCA